MVDNRLDVILNNNGTEKQLFVIMGELAELITIISDHFIRRRHALSDVADEIADVYLQINLLKRIVSKRYPNVKQEYPEYYFENLIANAFERKIEKAFKKSKEEKLIRDTDL